MKRNLMIAAAAGALVLAAGAPQPAQAQYRGGMRVAGHNWSAGPGIRTMGPAYGRNWSRGPRIYRSGYYGGGWNSGWNSGWGFGPVALLGGVAALATAPFWLAGGGFFPAGYGYDYGYDSYPVSYGGGYPGYYNNPGYVTYAPRRVVYTTRAFRPRVMRVRYAQPRRVMVQRAGYDRQVLRPQVMRPQAVQARRVMIRDGGRRPAGRVIVR